ncbi:hypothetical protein T552_03169 [Pneumocystis carinii B80]|uniref:Uncharacterized protein n=1 Tax=Pneumocystis carinii (strain B80) TaxID=1408658 RepID=A0A0W4ZC42_PNEC8|nr:hypothetical protein T552_03169 [Pneumocystis carinii B80]KTW25895.1 hypothetical protein T552_03169 [Pneumocystis carinii B80]
MPRPIRHPRDSIILEYSHSFSSGPQASSTPTQDPSNITWVSDLSPIATSTSKKKTVMQEDTSPDPFGFQEIRGIRSTFKTIHSELSPKNLETSEKETSSDSLSSQEENLSSRSTDEEEDLKLPSRKKSARIKPKDLKYEESEDEELPKKRRYTRKYQNITENIREEKEIYEKDINTYDSKKQTMSSKDIIEYFREVDKFELDVEDVPADYTSEN